MLRNLVNGTGMRPFLLAVVATCLLCPPLGPARSQSCNYSIDSVNFGSITPIDNQDILAQTTFRATCTGLPNLTVLVCLGIGGGSGSPLAITGPRLMLSGSNQLQFEIYSDASRTVRWGSIGILGSGTPPALLITLPSSLGSPASGSQTLYLKIFAGQQSAPIGTYLSDFANYTGVLAIPNLLGTCLTSGLQPVSFSVQALIENECDVTADPLNFGNHGVLTANVDAAADIHVTCTPGASYTVSLGNGQNGPSQTARKMANGTSMISYGLYSDPSRSVVLGSDVGATLSGTGTGSAETITVYGRVPPQSTPAAGTYQDTVVVNVTY
jgi:spore coat protein U-like protein